MAIQFRRRLARKLAAYSAAGVALTAAVGRAGIVYTDLGVEGVTTRRFEPFALDVDHDGTDDFSIDFRSFPGSLSSTFLLGDNGNRVVVSGLSARRFSYGETIEPQPALRSSAFLGAIEPAFLGLYFVSADGERAGWAEFTASTYGTRTFFGFAYETEANTLIRAGAVPEPPSLVLLAAGATGLAALRRKRRGESVQQ